MTKVCPARPQFLLSSYIQTVLTVAGQPQCLIMHAAFLNSPYTNAPIPTSPQYSQYSETSSALRQHNNTKQVNLDLDSIVLTTKTFTSGINHNLQQSLNRNNDKIQNDKIISNVTTVNYHIYPFDKATVLT